VKIPLAQKRPRLLIAGGYAAAGLVWIVAGHFGHVLLFGESAGSWLELAKGLVFVAVTAGVLYVFLAFTVDSGTVREPVAEISAEFLLSGAGRGRAILFVGIGGGLVAALGIATAVALWLSHADALRQGERDAANLALAVAEQTAQTLGAVDIAFETIGLSLQAPERSGVAADAVVTGILRERLATLHMLRGIAILDADGRLRHATEGGDVGADHSGEAYYRVHRDPAARGLYIGRPAERPGTDPSVTASRALQDADGNFRGVIVGALDPQVFATLWSKVDVGEHGSISLFGADAVLLMRNPPAPASIGQRYPDPLSAAISSPTGEPGTPGTFRRRGAIDGVERVYGYRPVPFHPPLVVVTGIAVEDILMPWRQVAITAGSFWLALLVLYGVFAGSALGYARRQMLAERVVRDLALFPLENPSPILRATRDGRLLYANPAGRQLLATIGGDAEGGATDRQRFVARFAGIRTSISMEVTVAGKEYRFTVTPVEDRGYVNVYGTDVSEAAAASRERDTAFARMRAAFDASPLAIVLYDTERRILAWSLSAEAMFGWTSDEVVGRPSPIMPPERTAEIDGIVTALSSAGAMPALETSRRRRDGSDVAVRVFAAPVRGATGELTGYLAAFENLGERNALIRDAATSRERLSLALETVEDGIWDWNFPTGDVYFSPAWERMIGYTPGEVRPHVDSWTALVHPDDRAEIDRILKDHLDGRSPVYETRHRLRHKDGHWVWVRDRGRVIERDADGRPVRAIGTHADLTQSMAMSEEISRLNRLLRAVVAVGRTIVAQRDRISVLRAVCTALAAVPDFNFVRATDIDSVGQGGAQILAEAGSAPEGYEAVESNGGFTARAAQTGEAQYFYMPGTEADGPGRTCSLAALPIRQPAGGDLVLTIGSTSEHAFGPRETEVLSTLARDIGFALSVVEGLARYEISEVARAKAEARLEDTLERTVASLAHTIEKRDPYTAGHQDRVARFSAAIADRLGLDDHRIRGLRLGCQLHDIGKIGIPAEILNKPGRLSPIEMELIRTHPDIGYEIIKDIAFDWPVASIVRDHHERLDGSGYPRGLRDSEICLEARIVAVADVAEAISSHRPYRPALGLAAAADELRRGRGTGFDAMVVDAAIELIDEGYAFDGDGALNASAVAPSERSS